MRITIVTGPWLPVPPIEGGSTGRIWQGLAEVFAVQGHQVTLLSKSHPQQPSTETLQGVNYLRIGGAKQSDSIVFDLFKDLLYGLTVLPKMPEADITIFHDFWLPALAFLRRKTLGKTVVFVGRMPKGQFWLYRGIDHFVVASDIVKEKLANEISSYRDKISLIPCPVETVFFLDQQPLSSEAKRFLYVGRIHPEKGLDILVQAFARYNIEYPEAQLDIVGPKDTAEGGGGKNYGAELEALVKGSKVTFHAAQYDLKKLREFYRQADIFIYPSIAEYGETFGLAPLEAMAAGVLPVVSDLDCFRGHIHHKKNGMVFNHRAENPVEELYACLKELSENASVREQLALQSSSDAKNYSYEAIAKQYQELFHTV